MVNTNALANLANLKLQKKQLEADIDVAKAEVVSQLEADELQSLSDPTYGTFSISKGKTKWTYTAALKKKMESIKIAQFKEQENGKATSELGTPFLTHKPIKV